MKNFVFGIIFIAVTHQGQAAFTDNSTCDNPYMRVTGENIAFMYDRDYEQSKEMGFYISGQFVAFKTNCNTLDYSDRMIFCNGREIGRLEIGPYPSFKLKEDVQVKLSGNCNTSQGRILEFSWRAQ
ncbi:MAG: hypothetical protein ACK5P5_10495 [Pseudobdellovibrionaceae bacterium]